MKPEQSRIQSPENRLLSIDEIDRDIVRNVSPDSRVPGGSGGTVCYH